MTKDRWQLQGNYTPWYFGWANCDAYAGEYIRKFYQQPSFLPKGTEPANRDWIFMGTPGFGAKLHLDNVYYPSWSALVCISKIQLCKISTLVNVFHITQFV